MVAISGRGWTLAPCLVALLEELDAGWPDRSRISDGTIGDAAHRARRSDHNPDGDGDVLALDITEDHDDGPDLSQFWHDVVERRDPRVRYLIYEGRIIKGYVDSAGRPAWVPQPYDGPNAHGHHLHVSVWDTAAAKANTGSWFDTPTPNPTEGTPDMHLIVLKATGKPASTFCPETAVLVKYKTAVIVDALGRRPDVVVSVVSAGEYDSIDRQARLVVDLTP